MPSSKVIVQVQAAGGGDFTELSWRKIKIKKSLDEICHSMELELPVSERNKIHKHDKVEIRLYNQFINDSNSRRRVSTILIDEITDSTDASSKNITAVGRSPARDIIDSTWSEIILGQQSLEAIAKKIANKFGIEVTRMPTNSPETGPVYSFSWNCESPWSKLLNESDNQGYIFTSNEAGGLYLWRVASGIRDEGFFLKEGQNIRNIQVTERGAEQYHEYIVWGNGQSQSQIDSTCKNKRVLTINLTDMIVSQEVLKRRALTEMRRRRDIRTTVTVSGWGLSDEQIKALGPTIRREIFWNPNFLIPVTIPSAGLNGNLLISEVNYEADHSSMSCGLTLVKREVYE